MNANQRLAAAVSGFFALANDGGIVIDAPPDRIEEAINIVDRMQQALDDINQQPQGKNMITLGQKARDKITGFEGILTGKAEYLYGCTQYALVPAARDGKLVDAQWFDEGRVEIVGEGVSATDVQGEKPGGPNRDAPIL